MLESLTVSHSPVAVKRQSVPEQTTEFVNTAAKARILLIQMEIDENGRHVVTSPDMPGLVTDGKDENEAAANAVEAIEALLESAGENVKDLRVTLLRKSIA